jgi:transcriptional regulator with XRE-family HTH domain
MQRIGERIKELREAKGWTQSALAHRMGITHTYVHTMEHVTKTVRTDKLVQLCRALDVDPNTLLLWEKK